MTAPAEGAWDPAAVVAPLLTRPELVVSVLAIAVVLLLVAVACLAVVAVRQRRELQDLHAQAEAGQSGSRAKVAAGWAVRQVLDTATRVRERGFFEGVLMAPIEDFARLPGEERDAIESVVAQDGTVTVLFSDIEGSTQLNEELGDQAFVRLLAEHDRVVRHQVGRNGGQVVKSQGDGFMVVFSSPQDAVAAAEAIQRKMSGRRRARRAQVRVRIGIHCGPVVSRDGDYFGRSVAKAARIAALADGGQTLVSADVRDRLDGDIEAEPRGRVELRGLNGEHEVYAVTH
jgi:class 3 adenylate cyclase